jgi:hypothetical protein
LLSYLTQSQFVGCSVGNFYNIQSSFVAPIPWRQCEGIVTIKATAYKSNSASSYTFSDLKLRSGCWYYECTIKQMSENCIFPIGWRDGESSNQIFADFTKYQHPHTHDDATGNRIEVVIGCLLEFTSSSPTCIANGTFYFNGSKANSEELQFTDGVLPLLCLYGDEGTVEVNLGSNPFRHSPPECKSLWMELLKLSKPKTIPRQTLSSLEKGDVDEVRMSKFYSFFKF